MNRLIATLKDSASIAEASSTPPASSAISVTPPGARHGDHRCSARQSLQHDIRKPLPAGAQNERIGFHKEGIGVLLEAGKAHTVRDAPLPRKLFERRAQKSFAQQRQPGRLSSHFAKASINRSKPFACDRRPTATKWGAASACDAGGSSSVPMTWRRGNGCARYPRGCG